MCTKRKNKSKQKQNPPELKKNQNNKNATNHHPNQTKSHSSKQLPINRVKSKPRNRINTQQIPIYIKTISATFEIVQKHNSLCVTTQEIHPNHVLDVKNSNCKGNDESQIWSKQNLIFLNQRRTYLNFRNKKYNKSLCVRRGKAVINEPVSYCKTNLKNKRQAWKLIPMNSHNNEFRIKNFSSKLCLIGKLYKNEWILTTDRCSKVTPFNLFTINNS